MKGDPRQATSKGPSPTSKFGKCKFLEGMHTQVISRTVESPKQRKTTALSRGHKTDLSAPSETFVNILATLALWALTSNIIVQQSKLNKTFNTLKTKGKYWVYVGGPKALC